MYGTLYGVVLVIITIIIVIVIFLPSNQFLFLVPFSASVRHSPWFRPKSIEVSECAFLILPPLSLERETPAIQPLIRVTWVLSTLYQLASPSPVRIAIA